MFVHKRFCRSKVSWQSCYILTSDLFLQPEDGFAYFFTGGHHLQAVVEIKQGFLQFPASLVRFRPGDVTFTAGGLGSQSRGGVVDGLVVVTQPPLTAAEVEQEVDVNLREALSQPLLLLLRDPLQCVPIPVRGV